MMKSRFLAFLLISFMLMAATSSITRAQDTAATEAPALDSPFRPTDLIAITDLFKRATVYGSPSSYKFAIVTNMLSPFWTATAIGEQRASSELGTSAVFIAPAKAGDIASQQSLLETLVKDGYSGIAFSAIDPASVVSVVSDGMDQGVNFMAIDSDSPDSKRTIFIGLDNHHGGLLAGQAMVDALGNDCGQVVGFVGLSTTQKAVDRIAGIKEAFEGKGCTLETVLDDQGDTSVAQSNSATALSTYPGLKGMIGIDSYNAPAAIQALKTSKHAGEVKLVAFDLPTETMQGLRDKVVSAAIGQRAYYYGYLSVYMLYAMSTITPHETRSMLLAQLSGDKQDRLDTGADVVTPENLDVYIEYLNSLGIAAPKLKS
ncbi:MAG: substrate-binding domain-containing protein [Chloroflexota bacterium]